MDERDNHKQPNPKESTTESDSEEERSIRQGLSVMERETASDGKKNTESSDSGVFSMSHSESHSRSLVYAPKNVTKIYNVQHSQQIKGTSEHYEKDRFPQVLWEPLRPLDTGEWKRLASRLGLDSYESSIDTDARNRQESPMRLVMDKFWQVQGKKANIERVKEALRDMERQDVVEALEDAEQKYNIDRKKDDTHNA